MASVPKSQYDDLQKRHENMRKSREREQRRCSKLEADNARLREAGANLSVGLAAIVIAERDNYAALIAHGKGEWPQNGYVRDETWAGWQHTLFVLNSILREAAS